MPSNHGAGEDSCQCLGLQGDKTSQSQRQSTLSIHWKDGFQRWNSNTLATWCEKLTHWKRPWCWERLKAGKGGDNRGWDGWMASLTRWTWVWASSGSWWWTGKPGVLQSTGSQRVRHDWATEHDNIKVFPGSSVVKKICLLMQETAVRSLGQEDLLEEKLATQTSSLLAWTIDREPGGLQC